MINSTELDERNHLSFVVDKLRTAESRLAARVEAQADGISEAKELFQEQQREMDHAEKASLRTMVNTDVILGESLQSIHRGVQRLLDSPYFARVDFRHVDEEEPLPVYIGSHTFRDADTSSVLIHDWRAPVSSLYYNFESGPANYTSPSGERRGDITAKRQFKISDGEMQYMIESSLNISDGVLQRELSESSSEKMGNIVATIQREQNEVIRNEHAEELVLQGVAGSGKTSIALHRLAFLLYRFRGELSSDQVLIISPNGVFGDYISGVLPELGEENVRTVSIESIAERVLGRRTKFETFNEQVHRLLTAPNADYAERIEAKASVSFPHELNRWIESTRTQITPAEIEVDRMRIGADWVRNTLARRSHLPIFDQLDFLVNSAVAQLKNMCQQKRRPWKSSTITSVRRQVKAMYPYADPIDIYRAYYSHLGRPDLMVMRRKTIEFADLFPLVYVTLKTSTVRPFAEIRHLLIDEMQDYTPIQYEVLKELFPCRKTILGDALQSVNPLSSSNLSQIAAVFPDAQLLEMNRTYRSTIEIVEFSQQFRPNPHLVPLDRHGPEPRVFDHRSKTEEMDTIRRLVDDFRRSDHGSLGIICRTMPAARSLADSLDDCGIDVNVLDYESTEFASGIVVTTAHLAKGLEFDRVIVPHINSSEYLRDIDRGMLYIAVTRAMHQLDLTYAGQPTSFLSV